MPRCDSCGKMVGLELGDPEIEETEPTIEDDTIETIARIIKECRECGDELKEADVIINHILDMKLLSQHSGTDHDLTVSLEDPEIFENHVPPTGKIYKTYYGVSVTLKLGCTCKPDILVEEEVRSSTVAAGEMTDV